MGLNNSIINHSGLFSFLICDKQLVKFYKKFGWKLINKKFFSIIDRESLKFGKTKFGMTYNYNLSVNNKFIFIRKSKNFSLINLIILYTKYLIDISLLSKILVSISMTIGKNLLFAKLALNNLFFSLK